MADAEEPPTPSSRRRLGLRRTAARAGLVARVVLRAVRVLRNAVWRLAQVLLAVIIVFEEWGWRPLVELLGMLNRLRLVAKTEALIAALPPYPALLVFALPSLLLLPLKLVALWLIAHGHVVMASLLFIGAKVVGTAIVARLFILTRPALMSLSWFAWIYNTVMPWKEALLAEVRASWAWRYGRLMKARLKQVAKAARAQLRPLAAPLLARMRAIFGRN